MDNFVIVIYTLASDLYLYCRYYKIGIEAGWKLDDKAVIQSIKIMIIYHNFSIYIWTKGYNTVFDDYLLLGCNI